MDRQQCNAHPQRPAYPHVSTTASAAQSVYQSSSSLASVSSPGSAASHPSPMSANSAPLPSPSASHSINYFGSMTAATAAPGQQQRASQGGQQPVGPTFVGHRGGSGGAPETAPFLKDFSLVAEAAKRAQMACLERDLGEVGL